MSGITDSKTSIKKILMLIDNEEYELGRFLAIRKQKDYRIINWIRGLIIFTIII